MSNNFYIGLAALAIFLIILGLCLAKPAVVIFAAIALVNCIFLSR